MVAPDLIAIARVEVVFLDQPEGQLPDGVYVQVEAPVGQEQHYQEMAIEVLQQRIGDSPTVS
jgi:hypothetical protein